MFNSTEHDIDPAVGIVTFISRINILDKSENATPELFAIYIKMMQASKLVK